jgi:uracil-DNA glycosylase
MSEAKVAPPSDVPKFGSLGGLNRSLVALHPASQHLGRVVTGEGPLRAAIAFVGEQPGDQEDLEGRPFVGPAGQLLEQILEEAGIERDQCYVTNAVKQFNFVRRGKRRLHQRPSTAVIVHYRWWLNLELEYVDPRIIVALGATAAFALTGHRVSVTAHRGAFELLGRRGFITTHPSAILRIPSATARRAARRAFLADLKKVRRQSELARRVGGIRD